MGAAHQDHASTVSMPDARCVGITPTATVYAKDIPVQRDRWPKGTLRCTYCEAEVQAVYSAPQERSRAKKPFFRRTPMPGGSNQHAPNCYYNVDERIRVIREDSAGALERVRSADRPKYRLVVPEAFGPPAPGGDPDAGGRVVAERMTQVLNTAAKIAALLEDYSDRGADVNIEWLAQCRGRPVEWLNFLYTPQRTWVLRNRLPEADSQLQHPVAVIFRADRAMRNPRPNYTFRASDYPLPPDPDPAKDILFVDGDHALVDHAFAAGLGKYYIGYGMWQRISYREENPRRLTLNLNHAALVAPIPDDIARGTRSRWRTWTHTES